ncbi:hypothetical protein HK104_006119 [Borealophlyctis nickersoniae]|nr:hypothetical protein HK104_006119 [Borealophlyctis nickersoniae]
MPSPLSGALTSAAAQRNLAAGPMQSTVYPPLDDVEALDKYMEEDPSNIVQVLPEIAVALERLCLGYPDACRDVWAHLKPLLLNRRALMVTQDPGERSRPKSPVCTPKPNKWVNVHGEEWEDDYSWLNDRENPEVLDYIRQENEYADKVLAHTKPLRKLLYKEFVARIDENEESAMVTLPDGWKYYSKKVAGEEYRLHCRIKDGEEEEVYLDENQLAATDFADASCFRVGVLKHSPDCRLIAYGIDSTGNERNTIFFKDMVTKQLLDDRIEGVYEDLEFGNDCKTVYYTILDDCERAYKLMRHRIGTDVTLDEVLYHEEDEMFFLSLTKTCDGNYIILNSAAQITSETRFISAHDPTNLPTLLFPRAENVKYTCEHHGKYFYILTNEASKNNWLFRIPIPTDADDQKSPEELLELRETVIEHRDFVLIEDFEVRRNHLIVFERSSCVQNVRIIDLRSDNFNSYHYIGFSEMVYSLYPGSVNEEIADLTKSTQFDTNILRFTYTSFIQPKQVIDYNMDDRTMTVVHEETVGGIFPYDMSMYASKRILTTGWDGTSVPVSLVYRRDLLGLNMNPPQPNPVLLHAYGAYGAFVNPIFSASRLSLLDRGFIYAAAHVRGGADMGNGWYEEGKLGKKPNTFYDFCSAAELLIKEGYTVPSKLGIYGRSAGGLLIGAVINMRPELFQAALTEVPFVDVINTMFDPSIPWTAFEYEEWGNPNDYDIYEVMKTYCPYTNIRGELLAKGVYPHLFVAGGMNDPRVAFWEPLKFVAKMRGERRKWRRNLQEAREKAQKEEGQDDAGAEPGIDKTQEKMIILRVDDAGHGGNSGQYSYLDDLAFEYAFLIDALDAPAKPIYPGLQGPLDAALSPMASPSLFSPASTYSALPHMVEYPPRLAGLSIQSLRDGGDDWDSEMDGDRSRRSMDRPKGKRRGKDDLEEREYRSKTKGDRGQNRVFQWVANLW